MDEKPLPHDADQLRTDIEGLVKESERLKIVAAENAERAKVLAHRIEDAKRQISPLKDGSPQGS